MKTCPICNHSYDDGVELCEFDGAMLPSRERGPDPLVGTTLRQRYKIVEKLGRGSMSDTYAAQQVQIGRRVLLKILNEEYAQDEAFVRRFRQEAKLLSSLSHPCLIQLFDFDQADDGRLFIVTEFLQGQTLRSVLQDQVLDIPIVVRLATLLVEGLKAAHAGGVIHRDINPENILVIGNRQALKITDFGLARVREGEAGTKLTQVGTILGNPHYVSPEQIEGGDTDERTDIYSLGIVLYEMLCNDVPFKAGNPTAIWMQHLNETALPPTELRPEIPSWLEAIVLRALEKKPSDRWGSMAEIAAALNQGDKNFEPRRSTPRPAVSRPAEAPKVTPQASIHGTSAQHAQPLYESAVEAERVFTDPVAPTMVLDSFTRTAPLAAMDTGPAEQKTIAQTMVMTQVVEKASANRINWKWLGLAGGLTAGAIIALYFVFDANRHDVKTTREAAAPIMSPPAVPAAISALTLEFSQTQLTVGQSGTLQLKAQRNDGSQMVVEDPGNVSWTSSNPAVAIADRRGRIDATGAGVTEVKARYMGMETTPLTITVKAQAAPPARVAKLLTVSIIGGQRELTPRESINLRAAAKYSDNKVSEINNGVNWESKNPNIATIDRTGKLTARKSGQVDIIARFEGVSSNPFAIAVKAPLAAQKAEQRPVKTSKPLSAPGVNDELRNARAFLDQGRYNEALSELAKANKIDPGNKEVQAATADAKRACGAEKRLGRADLRC